MIILLCAVFLVNNFAGNQVVNPNTDSNRSAEEGKDFAALYRHGEIFNAVGADEDIMSQIRSDILTFARVTRPEFADRDTLVGFTFDKKTNKEKGVHVYTGYYYDLDNRIEIRLTPRGSGVYTLSITNLEDKTNIDDFLRMNGPRNAFIRSLPIETGAYSVRYLIKGDKVVASFQPGYTAADLSEVEKLLTDNLGDNYEDDVVFSLNRIGSMTIDALRDNLVNPVPIPLR